MSSDPDGTRLSRRRLLQLAVTASASAVLPGCGSSSRPGDGRPNIVLVIADQLRANLLGTYGGAMIETPHLDRLAAEGMTFDRGLSTAPLCTPYRGMLMTGRHPTHSGIVLNRVEASPEQNPDCLGVLFQRAGYDTSYLGKWHLAAGRLKIPKEIRRDPRAMKIREALNPAEFVPPGPRRLGFRHWEGYNYHADVMRYWFYRDDPKPVVTDGYETDVIVAQALTYMEGQRTGDKPFLLIASPHPPHPPYVPGRCPEGYLERMPRSPELPPNVPGNATVRRDPEMVRCHLAMIQHLDDCVGQIVEYLDDSGLSENTLLVFTSDHGEMLESHGSWGKQLPYRESVDIPLIARWPGRVPAGQRSQSLYTPMDHLPTLGALAGIEVPGYLDGVDQSAALLGSGDLPREAALMMNPVASLRVFKSDPDFPEWRALRTDRHTYVSWRNGREQFFDDAEDPYQMRNLAEAPSPELGRAREQLRVLMAEAHDVFPPGSAYGEWYDDQRELVRTALGPVPTL